MTFNHDTFANELAQYTGITISNPQNNGVYTWDQFGATTGLLNQTMKYSKDGFDYETWYQETTSLSNKLGMLVSCKVDYKRDTGDDHIIILTGFSLDSSNKPVMVFAQASIQFHGSEDNNIVGTPVTTQTTSDLGQGIYDTLNAQIINDDFGNIDDSTAGRDTLPDIARANINSMILAMDS